MSEAIEESDSIEYMDYILLCGQVIHILHFVLVVYFEALFMNA